MKTMRELEAAHEGAFARAAEHADTCQLCHVPIVKDAEGNPGYYGEACARGYQLLLAWQEAEKLMLARMEEERLFSRR